LWPSPFNFPPFRFFLTLCSHHKILWSKFPLPEVSGGTLIGDERRDGQQDRRRRTKRFFNFTQCFCKAENSLFFKITRE
jgi:hypothetical protein